MPSDRDFLAALDRYAEQRQLSVRFDDDDRLVWQTSDGLTLTIALERDDEAALLVVGLGPWPALTDDDDRVMRTLLEANLAYVGSRGGAFAIDPELDQLVVYRRIAMADADADRVATAIDDLSMAAAEFVAELQLEVG